MANFVIENEPCYIYHVRSFRESSVIMEVLSLNYGRLQVMLRGAQRGRKSEKGLFQPFTPLKLTMVQGQKRDGFYYLQDYEFCKNAYELRMPDYFCGIYLNELLHNLLTIREPDLSLFATYISTLESISKRDEVEKHLRIFELNLFKSLGYGISACDDEGAMLVPDEYYRFCLSMGFLHVPPELLEVQWRAATNALQKINTASILDDSDDEEDEEELEGYAEDNRSQIMPKTLRHKAKKFDDSALLFAKSKVKGPKLSDFPSYGSALRTVGFNQWWQELLNSGTVDSHIAELAYKLEKYGYNLMGPVLSGAQIKDIVSQEFKLEDALRNAKYLTSSVINRLMGGRAIESRRLYREYREMLQEYDITAAATSATAAAGRTAEQMFASAAEKAVAEEMAAVKAAEAAAAAAAAQEAGLEQVEQTEQESQEQWLQAELEQELAQARMQQQQEQQAEPVQAAPGQDKVQQ